MLRMPEASVCDQASPLPVPGDRHARRRPGALLARALLFAAVVVVASACSSGDLGGGGGGGGGGSGGPDDAGSGSSLDLNGENGVTATFGATRYTATDNVSSNVLGVGFLFGASKDRTDGPGSELIWSIIGEAEVGTLQRCGDDVQVSLIVQEAGGGTTTWGSTNCALEVDALGNMAVGGVWPITGRFAGTFVNLATPVQSFTVTDGVFHYTAF
jgi:hypothetical protein